MPVAHDRRPAVRALSIQDVLAQLDSYRTGLSKAVRALVPDDVLETIDRAPRMSWIDVEDDIWVPSAFFEVLGEEDATEMLRNFMASHFEGPLLRPMVQGTVRSLGLTPVSLIRMIPVGWRLAYRDVCRPRVAETGHERARLVFEDVAPTVIESDAYPRSFRAILLGCFDVTRHEGEVEIDESDEKERRLGFRCRWRES